MTQPASLPSSLNRSQLSDSRGKASDFVSGLGPQLFHYSQKLNDLSSRHFYDRLHLAVLGQFNRGKNALFNALTGEPLLRVGVVPLTAAPTFPQYGAGLEKHNPIIKERR